MAVKMLTTKKHVKTAKTITKIKEENETNKASETIVVDEKKPTLRPMLKLGQTINTDQYFDAKAIVKQYEIENPKPNINLFETFITRTANGIILYFNQIGIIVDANDMDVNLLKQINLSKIISQRNFGKNSMIELINYLHTIK